MLPDGAKAIYGCSGFRYVSDIYDLYALFPYRSAMSQLQLPLFPEGITLINQNIGFLRQGSTITYPTFNKGSPKSDFFALLEQKKLYDFKGNSRVFLL